MSTNQRSMLSQKNIQENMSDVVQLVIGQIDPLLQSASLARLARWSLIRSF